MDTNALEVYLIGAPGCGKTTAFCALTGGDESSHLRIAKVPDARLDRLEAMFQPRKKTPAEIAFCDIFAHKTAELSGRHTERFTAALGTADMFAIVIACFGEYDAEGRPLDPAATLDEVLLELVVADHSVVERRLQRIEADLKKGKKDLLAEQAVLQRCLECLEQEQPLKNLAFDEAESRLLRGFSFLTFKPAIVLANVSEAAIADEPPAALVAKAAERGFETVTFCAQVESEIASLDPGEQASFLADYGIAEPVGPRLIRACYHSLDLISFLTAGGPDEVRAWTIHRGTRAQAAAGAIHSDIERGFIRAETVAYTDLDRLGSFAACREAGLLRLEGKEYIVQDGDVITFRFNV